MRVQSLGFEFVSGVRGEDHQSMARFACTTCDAALLINLRRGMNRSPDHIARMARVRGWAADAQLAQKARCPTCLKPPRKRRDTKERPMTITPIKGPSLVAKPPGAVVVPTEPTPDQRMKIRGFLDKHFDDAAGVYLDGVSDHKIAEQVGVARRVVETMRETAYGPIRVAPEIMELRNELANARNQIEQFGTVVSQALDRIKGMEVRLDKILSAPA